MTLERKSEITEKFPREILLLKGRPCAWAKCSFCDYTLDNEVNEALCNEVNLPLIEGLTGKYGRLEIINSGNVFELPLASLEAIKEQVSKLKIKELFLEAHWIYRNRLQEMRDYFPCKVVFKTGVETFDIPFREEVLKKGFGTARPEDIARYFDSACLLVGIEGQNRAMIIRDIEEAKANFSHFTVNLYIENTSKIRADLALQTWFKEAYSWLDKDQACEVLWHNTDFGVG